MTTSNKHWLYASISYLLYNMYKKEVVCRAMNIQLIACKHARTLTTHHAYCGLHRPLVVGTKLSFSTRTILYYVIAYFISKSIRHFHKIHKHHFLMTCRPALNLIYCIQFFVLMLWRVTEAVLPNYTCLCGGWGELIFLLKSKFWQLLWISLASGIVYQFFGLGLSRSLFPICDIVLGQFKTETWVGFSSKNGLWCPANHRLRSHSSISLLNVNASQRVVYYCDMCFL